jgi:RNA recognition motif-containing protein
MNIYVGNLSRQAVEMDLRALFSEFGEIKSLRIIRDNTTGESRGFGFVEMPDKEGGLQAIDALNGREFQNRTLKINEAKPKNAVRVYNSFSSNYGYKDRNNHN